MDNTTPKSVLEPTPTPNAQAAKKNSLMPLLILLALSALIITGIAYIVINPSSSKKSSNQPQNALITPSLTPSPLTETTVWKQYTNTKYKYSLAYPTTWTISSDTPDQKSFDLRNTTSNDSGIIKITYLTTDEASKRSLTPCEKSYNKSTCQTHTLTPTSEALISRTDATILTKLDAYIARPKGETILIQITDPNEISYESFTVLLATMRFPNEKIATPMKICPDTWPTTEKTVEYNGVTFPTEDVDAVWVKKTCK